MAGQMSSSMIFEMSILASIRFFIYDGNSIFLYNDNLSSLYSKNGRK